MSGSLWLVRGGMMLEMLLLMGVAGNCSCWVGNWRNRFGGLVVVVVVVEEH